MRTIGMTFRPSVLAAKPELPLTWQGHLFIPGLFVERWQVGP